MPHFFHNSFKRIADPNTAIPGVWVPPWIRNPSSQDVRHPQARQAVPVNRKTVAPRLPLENTGSHTVFSHHPSLPVVRDLVPFCSIPTPPKAIYPHVASVIWNKDFRTIFWNHPKSKQLLRAQTSEGHLATQEFFFPPGSRPTSTSRRNAGRRSRCSYLRRDGTSFTGAWSRLVARPHPDRRRLSDWSRLRCHPNTGHQKHSQ